MSFHSRCISCGSSEVRRSHRRDAGERVFLRMMFRAPYRCTYCNYRYIDWYLGPRQSEEDYGPMKIFRFWAISLMWIAIFLLFLRFLVGLFL